MRERLAPALDGGALWPLAREQAKERQKEGGKVGGGGEASENFTEASAGETRNQVGAAVGMSDSQKFNALNI